MNLLISYSSNDSSNNWTDPGYQILANRVFSEMDCPAHTSALNSYWVTINRNGDRYEIEEAINWCCDEMRDKWQGQVEDFVWFMGIDPEIDSLDLQKYIIHRAVNNTEQGGVISIDEISTGKHIDPEIVEKFMDRMVELRPEAFERGQDQKHRNALMMKSRKG